MKIFKKKISPTNILSLWIEGFSVSSENMSSQDIQLKDCKALVDESVFDIELDSETIAVYVDDHWVFIDSDRAEERAYNTEQHGDEVI